MKKIIVLILMLFLFSGCTVKSNITVNYDGSVKETVYLLEKNDFFKDDEMLKDVVDNKVSNYDAILSNKNYKHDYEKGNELSGAKVYKKHDNLCTYFTNSAFNQYVYEFMECIEDDYYYEIKNKTEHIPYCRECSDWPALDSVELRVVLPVSADEQNADEIDNTTYIWKYDKDTTSKDFYLKISKEKLKTYKKSYEEKKEKKEAKKRIINTTITIIVICVLTFVLIPIVIKLYKKYKNNKIDY